MFFDVSIFRGWFPIAWPSRSGNLCVPSNCERTNMHIIIWCAAFALSLQARQRWWLRLFAILFFPQHLSKISMKLSSMICSYYLISFAICTRFLNLCNEKMSLAINGRVHFRGTFGTIFSALTAHIMHNLNTEITLRITVYVCAFDGGSRRMK